MSHFLIGIAGASGCGKSTLAYGLKFRYPDWVEVVHFDDYQKEEKDVPKSCGMSNWDHPDAIDFGELRSDLKTLKSGSPVEVMTKSSVLNPNYEERGRVKHVLEPRRIMFVEGYLALHDPSIKKIYDYTIYLDIPIKESVKRREKITYNDEDEYNSKILVPMHAKYVAPCKDKADLVVDVLKYNAEEVQQIVSDALLKKKILI